MTALFYAMRGDFSVYSPILIHHFTGNMPKPKQSTFEINGVTVDEDTELVYVPNPKRPGGTAFERYERYWNARTLREYFDLNPGGFALPDLRYDHQHGFVAFTHPAAAVAAPAHDEEEDFARVFAWILGLLVLFTIVIALIARAVGMDENSGPMNDADIDARTKPYGSVQVGAAGHDRQAPLTTRHAPTGVGATPLEGGRPALTDAQTRAIVAYRVDVAMVDVAR